MHSKHVPHLVKRAWQLHKSYCSFIARFACPRCILHALQIRLAHVSDLCKCYLGAELYHNVRLSREYTSNGKCDYYHQSMLHFFTLYEQGSVLNGMKFSSLRFQSFILGFTIKTRTISSFVCTRTYQLNKAS